MRVKYKNMLFHTVKDEGFAPGDFNVEINDADSTPSTIFNYRTSSLYFSVWNQNNSFDDFFFRYTKYAPSEQPEKSIGVALKFEYVRANFKIWLIKHVREYQSDLLEPDLWSEYLNGSESLNYKNIDFEDRNPFTQTERIQVAQALKELEFLIAKNFNPIQEQLVLINGRLNYLQESTDRLNKTDWKGVALSTMIGILTTLGLDSNDGKLLFELFIQVFSTIHFLGN